MDFMLVACDGVFDAFNNTELFEYIWEKAGEKVDGNVHSLGARLVNGV